MIIAETRHLLPSTLPLLLLPFILVVTTYARSWDLAVVIDNGGIDFFAKNGTLMNHANIEIAKELNGITYDYNTQTMYISDIDPNSNITVFNVFTKKNFTSTPLIKKDSEMHILGIAFDKSSNTLFWTDTKQNIIVKMSLNGESSTPIVMHQFTDASPRDIAIDACNRRIYWTNNNLQKPTIESSTLDGKDRTTIVNTGLYQPLALAIDHAEQKLYWSDDSQGNDFKIERSNLDGSEREVLIDSSHHQPAHLAVDNESVYWSDWIERAVWTIPKNGKGRITPVKFASYDPIHPAGIVTRDNEENNCAAIFSQMEKRTKFPEQRNEPLRTTTERSSDPAIVVTEKQSTIGMETQPTTGMGTEPTTRMETKSIHGTKIPPIKKETTDLTTECSNYCLNNGKRKTDGTCQCKLGFYGYFCEISHCYNYCLHGNTCTINSHGLPECKCKANFSGARCERNICDGYCLHDGECSVQNGKPYCDCKYSKGTRCEELSSIVQVANVTNRVESFSEAPCRCTDANRTAERIISAGLENSTILPIFVALTGLFLLTTVVLSYYVNKLRRRPRIKKRYVVGKGVTQLTSRPQIPDNQCEITIENCCNMNICETPCFEPKLRTEAPRSKKTKKEEKHSLLDNMDNSC
ncbi:protein cueball isoform X1 [Linepithema humile]|uniref:protein cueball isoform X1 n=2 Tax=Linepithema humile TaxID=83485 RepID=UPI00351EB18B